MSLKNIFLTLLIGCFPFIMFSGNGYDLWLRYDKITDVHLKQSYLNNLSSVYKFGASPSLDVATKELVTGFHGFFEAQISKAAKIEKNAIVLGTKENLPQELLSILNSDFEKINEEGYILKKVTYQGKKITIITAKTDVGIVYGTFRLLKEIQLHHEISALDIQDSPKIQKRVLNHWDNLDRTVERGYAGFSIWDWHHLPDLIKTEYIDYARANASIGINGTVLTNVNANALVLTEQYITKVKALADVFRPFGIQVYLTARFSAPMEIGGLKTADPLAPEVRAWWSKKTNEIYAEIPDFGGFVVKANSEGQPGPRNYDRSHVDGANMLADALAPHKGIVMWRAFVYSEENPDDRAKQAYSEFVPVDGDFRENVLLQVKNGAIDFQPREPFHPLFGAMPDTNIMMEFQITQEYLGFSSHLVFLPKMWEEVLNEDTFTHGENATVAKVIDGSLSNRKLTGMAGVANIGTEKNWTGHPFGQANWYGFGRLAWDPYLDSKTITKDWLQMTFTNDDGFVTPMAELMIDSREAVVNYMTPLGLHHIMDAGHHYGPGPWIKDMPRADWTSVYYHKADSLGIGFDRTVSGSDALSQYALQIQKKYDSPETIPQKYLLWFHHLPWNYKMENGQNLWINLASKYQEGVEEVEKMNTTWSKMKPFVDNERFNKVASLLKIQLKEAKWWRDACLLYFQQFSKMELPQFIPTPEHNLEYYQSLKSPYAPGIKPSWN
ncbi:alpha-glucuronidase [Gillisia sp. M10.2A]|uniref:Xylan alpha-1,2-glucuronidase n=1 Tax=Gillisia lutea TaxID=2909668 RepID=A0ABS9EDZ7_9FLAO|nr:alpha-glucuronidase family glycosyl hydrolase [Gillisia lutea]MCF4101090.1 alpha-glucuronidase [Gillisia lutea]